MRISFQEELDELEPSLRGEGELVLRSLRGAVEAVCSQDLELADEVIAFDDDIDAQYFEVEQGIELLLARQTPVASDLRLVLALLKDNLHLERMGDLCVTIAKLTKLTKGLPPDETLLEGFKEMGERAEQMIRVALRSLEQRDRVAAESLLELDELIDRANRRVVNRLLELGHDLEAARVGAADDPRLALPRADRRPRRRHRRADRVPRHRRVPRVHRRLASTVAPKLRARGAARKRATGPGYRPVSHGREVLCDREVVLLAIVAQRSTATNVALAAAAPRGVDARILAPGAGGRRCCSRERSRSAGSTSSTGSTASRTASGRSASLAARGVVVLNRAGALLAVHDKLLTAKVLQRAGLPHPAHADPPSRRSRAALGGAGRRQAALRQLGPRRRALRATRSPSAATCARSSTGSGSSGTARSCRSSYQPAGFDLRIVVAGGVAVGAISRVAAPGEWRTNIALGGTRVAVEPPAEALELAVRAAQAAGADLIGVDLLPDGAGGHTVLELNGAVDFTREYRLDRDPFVAAAAELDAARVPAARETAAGLSAAFTTSPRVLHPLSAHRRLRLRDSPRRCKRTRGDT